MHSSDEEGPKVRRGQRAAGSGQVSGWPMIAVRVLSILSPTGQRDIDAGRMVESNEER